MDPYMPLGTPFVSPIDQASAFSTFANLGVHRPWHVLAQVIDADRQEVYAAPNPDQQTVEPDIAQDVSYALTQVVRSGTGRAAGTIGYPVAGKTGSKGQPDPDGNGPRQTVAAWFVGYTKQISTAVMYVRGEGGHEDLGYGWYGSGAPAQTWAAYMRIAMQGKTYERLPGPTNKKSTQTPTPEPSPTPTWTPPPTPPPPPPPPPPPAPTESATQSTPPSTAPPTGATNTPSSTPT
jgi:membrane peptidoglycan carboxypeptidase